MGISISEQRESTSTAEFSSENILADSPPSSTANDHDSNVASITMESHSVETTEQTTLSKSSVQLDNSGRTTIESETTNDDYITDSTKTDKPFYTKNTTSDYNQTTDANYSSRSLESDTSTDYAARVTNLNAIDNITNPDFGAITDISVVPSNDTTATTTMNIGDNNITGETNDPLTTRKAFSNTSPNTYETSETNTEISVNRTVAETRHDSHTTLNHLNTTASVPDTSHFTTSGNHSLSSQYDGATKPTDYEKLSNEATTESTFDQTNLSVNTTGNGTGNVTRPEVTDGLQNMLETTNGTTAHGVTVTENVTTFNTDVLPSEVVYGKKSRLHNSFPWVNFECFVSSRCERFHYYAMQKSIKARMNRHKIHRIDHTQEDKYNLTFLKSFEFKWEKL